MHKSILIQLLLFCVVELIANGVYGLYGPSSPVLQLNPNNFNSKVVNSNSIVLVEFFAPWCGHCQQLTPTWEKAASVLKGVVTVAALDADAHKSLAQEYGIRGFPTLKVFAPGKPPVDYQGARDVKPIAEFALQQIKALLKERLDGKSTGGSSQKSEPSESVELNSHNFDELVIKSKELWIVEFFAPWCGHCKKLAPEWKKAARNLKGLVKLGHVDCDADKELFRTSAYHPQSDGQTETVNRIVEMYLRCFSGDFPNKWLSWLPWSEFCWGSSSFMLGIGFSFAFNLTDKAVWLQGATRKNSLRDFTDYLRLRHVWTSSIQAHPPRFCMHISCFPRLCAQTIQGKHRVQLCAARTLEHGFTTITTGCARYILRKWQTGISNPLVGVLSGRRFLA